MSLPEWDYTVGKNTPDGWVYTVREGDDYEYIICTYIIDYKAQYSQMWRIQVVSGQKLTAYHKLHTYEALAGVYSGALRNSFFLHNVSSLYFKEQKMYIDILLLRYRNDRLEEHIKANNGITR